MELTVNYEVYDVFNHMVFVRAVTKVRDTDDADIEKALKFFKKNKESVLFALDDNKKGYQFTWYKTEEGQYKLWCTEIHYVNYTENKGVPQTILFAQVKKLITGLLG